MLKEADPEICACLIEVPDDVPVIGAAYRPLSTDLRYMKELMEKMWDIYIRYHMSPVWIAGDMNLSDIFRDFCIDAID